MLTVGRIVYTGTFVDRTVLTHQSGTYGKLGVWAVGVLFG